MFVSLFPLGQRGMVSPIGRMHRHRRIPAVPKALYMYSACIFAHQRPLLMPLTWLAAMGFDLVILVVTISGLWFMVPGGRGGLWRMLFADGVVYFTLVASANSVPAVCPLCMPPLLSFGILLISVSRSRA